MMDNKEIWEKILWPNLKKTNLRTLESRLRRISRENSFPELEVSRNSKYCSIFYRHRYIGTSYEFSFKKPDIDTFPDKDHQQIKKIWETVESMYKKR